MSINMGQTLSIWRYFFLYFVIAINLASGGLSMATAQENSQDLGDRLLMDITKYRKK